MAAQEEFGLPFSELEGLDQNNLLYYLKVAYRTNTYQSDSSTMVVSERRAEAMAQTADYYDRLFGGAPELATTRQNYDMKEETLSSAAHSGRLTEYFVCSAWAYFAAMLPGR